MASGTSRDNNRQSDQSTSASITHLSTQAQVKLIPHLTRRLNPASTGKKLTSGNTEKHWIQRFKRDELPNQQRSYKLSVLQQPVRARLSSFKEANETSTSRFNPPNPALRSPSVSASRTRPLTSTTSQAEQIRPTDPYPVVKTATGANATAGDWVMSTEMLCDINGGQGSFCVFSKLSIRVPGKFRLRFILYEKNGTSVHKVSSTVTDPFEVFSPKKYPGMMPSTDLTRYFASQGMKLKLRAGVARNSATAVTTGLDELIREEDGAVSRGTNGTGTRGTKQTATKAGKAKAKEAEKEPELESNTSQKSGPGKGRGRKRLAESPPNGSTAKVRSIHKSSSAVSWSVLEESVIDTERGPNNGALGRERDPHIGSTGEAVGSFDRASKDIGIDPVEFGADDPSLPFTHPLSALMPSSSLESIQPSRSHLPSIRELVLSAFDWNSSLNVSPAAGGPIRSSSRGFPDSWNQYVNLLGGNLSQTNFNMYDGSSVEPLLSMAEIETEAETPATATSLPTRNSTHFHLSSRTETSTPTPTPSMPSSSYSGTHTACLPYPTTQISQSQPPTSFSSRHQSSNNSSHGQGQSQVQNQNQPVGYLMQRPLESQSPYRYPSHPSNFPVDHALYTNFSFSNHSSNAANHGHLHSNSYSQYQHQIQTQAFQSESLVEQHLEPEPGSSRAQELASRRGHMHPSMMGFHSEQVPPRVQQYPPHSQQHQYQQLLSQHPHSQQNWNVSGPGIDQYEWPIQNRAEPLFRAPRSNIRPGRGLTPDNERRPGRQNSTGGSELGAVDGLDEENARGRR
ncbi:cop9 signalosome subunit 7 [Phaffia rhodozyma]|uniref:Cop9 signalosome subunit 7 n=1 Tax=Phaffia rhodozyma TaxID=264483 RepID=A0A0F7SQ64_PHARH|nr:cop9 signalosome subunit 7 [Phaffia rhodozyma]